MIYHVMGTTADNSSIENADSYLNSMSDVQVGATGVTFSVVTALGSDTL